MHGAMANICEFKNVKSANMENPQNINPTKLKAHTVLHLVSPLGESLSNIQEESTINVSPPRYAGFRIAAVYENPTVGTGEPRPPPEGSGFGV